MLVKEDLKAINTLITKILTFVKYNAEIQREFDKVIEGRTFSESEWETFILSFVFERLFDDNKKVFDIYKEKADDLSEEDKEILSGMDKSVYSMFEVKKVNKDGFELYNIVNEKTYHIQTLIKIVNFRGIMPGQYIACRFFPYESKNYLVGIDNVLPASMKENAYRYAVSQQMSKPELLYQDNKEKLAEIEQTIQNL